MARTLCLLGSKAAGVKAIDGILANFRDSEALDKEAVRSRKDGFNAKFAIHPDQIAVINARFAPDAREIERARAIVAAFEAAGGAGTVQLDGVMLDMPAFSPSGTYVAAVNHTGSHDLIKYAFDPALNMVSGLTTLVGQGADANLNAICFQSVSPTLKSTEFSD